MLDKREGNGNDEDLGEARVSDKSYWTYVFQFITDGGVNQEMSTHYINKSTPCLHLDYIIVIVITVSMFKPVPKNVWVGKNRTISISIQTV